jgi:hypothetical protein
MIRHCAILIEIAGTSPAMTPRVLLLLHISQTKSSQKIELGRPWEDKRLQDEMAEDVERKFIDELNPSKREEVKQPSYPRYPAAPPWIPHSNTWDAPAVLIAAFQRLNRAAVLATSGAAAPPFPPPVAANAVTQQEQPDHPRSHIWPSVQDPPTEPAPPSTVSLEGRITISAKAHAGMTLHDEMLRRIASLEDGMARLAVTKPGIGHNNPPDPVPFGDDDRRVVEIAIVVLSAQSPKPETSPVEAGEAAAKLMTIGERLNAYAIKHGDVLVSEAVKSAGAEVGKRLVQLPFWLSLAGLLIAAAKAAFAWIASLPSPH